METPESIKQEEIDGLLAEADHAEATGGMVQLTPLYTRHLMNLVSGKPAPAACRNYLRNLGGRHTSWCRTCGHVGPCNFGIEVKP